MFDVGGRQAFEASMFLHLGSMAGEFATLPALDPPPPPHTSCLYFIVT